MVSVDPFGSVNPSAPAKSEREVAFSHLLTNLLVLPGLGSLLGQRRVGYFQAAFAIGGMILSLQFAWSFARQWVSLGTFPLLELRQLTIGLLGIALFAAGWLWALITSLLVLRRIPRPKLAAPGSGGAGAVPPRLQ